MTTIKPLRTSAVGAVAALGLVLTAVPGATTSPPPEVTAAAEAPAAAEATAGFEDGRYIVVMDHVPVAAYEGTVSGYAATSPEEGEDFAPESAEARRYRSLLVREQERAMRAVGADADQQYTDTVSGFAAELSGDEAAALARRGDVVAVVPDELRTPDSSVSPGLLGLSSRNGVWDQLGGVMLPSGAGGGVVVGVIDTGIRPEHPSFTDRRMLDPSLTGWRGECDPGEAEGFRCNDKLVGARYYAEGFGVENLADYESLSPLDIDGHGTHTASTAAGNHGVRATIAGQHFGRVSGMAPKAHVAAYKVCWYNTEGANGCADSDSVAAVEDAVADGVDVINYSISGTLDDVIDPVELAFLGAAEAGVFVATSAGNDGPGESTVAHPSPWVTSVAAATHTVLEGTLVTGDGERYIGASLTGEVPEPAPMVVAEDIAAEGVSAGDAALCLPGSLDAAGAAGRIVVCDRGVNARVEKSQVVADAGGVGMVLVNVTESSLDADFHAVPTVHLSHVHRDAVREYVRTAADPVGRILDANEGSTTQVPEVAGFSSRGPSLAASNDLLKPDIAAPGVSVLAGTSPALGGESFGFLSGTSMASPHIAGLAALVRQAHPEWSPMEIKSAMMTTALPLASEASSHPFAVGAGFVEPREFLSPGLVYRSGSEDWWDYLAGQGITFGDGTPVSDNPIDGSDLNLPSIAIGALVGSQTVPRAVTGVGPARQTFTAHVEHLEGIDVEVSPRRVTLAEGQSRTVEITFTTTGEAAMDEWATGTLVWTGSRGDVARSPIVVRPRAASAPAMVSVPADAGTVEIEVLPGFDGTLGTDVDGLAPGLVTPATAPDTGGAGYETVIGTDQVHMQDFTVTGEPLVRIELRSDNPDGDDLDLFLTERGSTDVIALSATATADEVIMLDDVPAGEYTLHVQAWAVEGDAAEAAFDVRLFQVPDDDLGTLVIEPAEQLVEMLEPVTFTGTVTTQDRPLFGRVNVVRDGEVVTSTLVAVG